MNMNNKPNLVGHQIDEYRLEALLGVGAMAWVYRAIDVRLNRYVAIKVIQTSFRDNSAYTVRFEREAQAIAQLQHPNIITLYRFGDKDGLLYLAMQYIHGADLAAVIDSFRQENAYISNADVIRVAKEVGSALDYAHSNGVIHRDVKPHNIMINSDNRAILTDFGLALMAELGTTQGEVFGSPHYIAPEQAISSAGVVPQSDLYAFAVVLYEMLTNHVPFYAATPLDIATMHINEPVPSPRIYRPELPEAVEQVLFRALAKNPLERYATGRELAGALDEALTGAARATPLQQGHTTIAERVALEREAHPLPPIPVVMSPAAVPTPPQAAFSEPEATRPIPPVQAIPRPVTMRTPKSKLPLYAGIGGAIGLCALISLFAIISSGIGRVIREPTATADPLVVVATDLPAVSTQPNSPINTVLPPVNPPPTIALTANVPLIQPVGVSTAFQVGLNLLNGGRGLTTGQVMNNGEMEVEGYCTRLNPGYGVGQDGVNWYCTQNGQNVQTLTNPDFDEICRQTYSNPNATAVQIESSAPVAYRWRCFAS